MLNFITLFIVTSLLFSCYPGGDTDIEDLDTATTVYKKTDFNSAPKSAIVVWKVVEIKGDDGNNLPYRGEIDKEILNTTLDNLVDLYGVDNVYIVSPSENPTPTPSNSQVEIITQNDPDPNADMAILTSILLRKNVEIGWTYPPYWWWGCYYCWYYPVPYYIDYEVGTVLVSMKDSDQVGDDTGPSWTGIIRGLLSSSNTFNADRAVSGIDQAFDQSPYLK